MAGEVATVCIKMPRDLAEWFREQVGEEGNASAFIRLALEQARGDAVLMDAARLAAERDHWKRAAIEARNAMRRVLHHVNKGIRAAEAMEGNGHDSR